jgi:hypothetical protein
MAASVPLAVTTRLLSHARRHGNVITVADARRLGATSRHLAVLTRGQVFTRPHPGVYALDDVQKDHALATRAAIASLSGTTSEVVDRRAIASHRSAAWLQGLLDHPPTTVELTADEVHYRRRGVVIHQTRHPVAPHRFQDVPCTPPARTLADLAAVLKPVDLADVVDRALSRRLVRTTDLWAQTRKPNAGRRGSDRLRRCLEERGDTAPHPSVLESRMARLAKRARMPLPEPEVIAGGHGEYRIDYAYRRPRVALELHSYTWHHSPEQMAADLTRQRRLTLQGWTVLVFTWRDVTNKPDRVADDIRAALSRAASAPTPASTRVIS